HLIDPGSPGQGVHDDRQPPHLLINTLASQVTMCAPRSVLGGPPVDPRPSLVEWAQSVGYRRVPGGSFVVEPPDGETIAEHDYLPRRLLGEYLGWTYRRIVSRLPSHITLFRHCTVAVDINPQERVVVELADGTSLRSDYVFVASGHGNNALGEHDAALAAFADQYVTTNSKLLFCGSPYPVHRLSDISPSAVVAVQGLGLAAHDVISELTVGRGGQFSRDGENVRYLPCGREPRMLVFSRNC